MPLPNLVILLSFTVLGVAMFVLGARYRGQRIKFWGKPTIENVYFVTGKVSLFSSWGLLLLKSILTRWNWNQVPEGVAWFAALLSCLGTGIMIVSFYDLGASVRVGLPETVTNLQTKGIYRISRNPMYLGVFLVCIASSTFFPNPVNLGLALYGMIIHHRIILGEEKFLEERFGPEWQRYKERVRRYV
ncbi:MAG: isoprenylcysteine carboxylmethyltransferase family protein [bacterium]